MKIAFAFAAMVLAGAAQAAPADPILTKVVAGARAVPPSSISFDRSSKVTARDDKGATETSVRIERWDGKALVLISRNGKPATPEEVAEAAKASKGRPVAGYHRLGDYLAAGARRISEKPGQIVYRVDKLPKGSVDMGGDRSDKFGADVTVDTSGAVPVATRMHIFLPAPFSIMFVAKVDKFDIVNDYGAGKDGRPALLRSTQLLAGAQFGKAGETRTEAVFTPLR